MKDCKPMELCAEDIMQRQLFTVHANETLARTEQLLTEADISGVPVIDDGGHLLGVLSMRDLIRHRSDDGELPKGVDPKVFDNEVGDQEQVAFVRPPTGACAADVMTQDVVSVPPTMPLPLVASRMVSNRVHRVMVIDRGRLIGLVSATEMLGVMAGMT